jgi:hypothetical protein
MQIKVGFGKNDKPLAIGSKLIRAVEGCPYSHCWIEVDNNVYEAVFPKSRVIPKSEHIKHYDYVEEFLLFQDSALHFEMIKFLKGQVGKWYATPQLVLIAIGFLGKKINALVSKVDLNGNSQLICTEFCARFLSKFFNAKIDETFDSISLKDLHKICKDLELKNDIWKP